MTTEPIDTIIAGVVAAETAQYTENPHDPPTKYGITLPTLQDVRAPATITKDDLKQLTEAEAIAIYRDRYVAKPHFDMVAALDPALGAYAVNCGVMSGPLVPAKILQRVCNVMNKRGSAYADIPVDGKFGPGSQLALRELYKFRGGTAQGSTAIRSAFVCLWGAFLIGLAEANQEDEDYIFGWIQGRIDA